MLLEFKCANHIAIKEQVSFSMVAGTDNTHEESLIKFDKFRVLPAAVIYGANGSGKSSFLDAFGYMRNFIVNSDRHDSDDLIDYTSHKLSEEYTPCEYEVQFVYNNVRYAYGFAIKPNADDIEKKIIIDSEYLYYFPNNRPVKIFEREGMDLKPGDKYKNAFEFVIRNTFTKNRLFLSCAGKYSDIEEVKAAYTFFKIGIKMVRTPDRPYPYPTRRADDRIVGMLRYLGTNIAGVRVDPLDRSQINFPPTMSDSAIESYLRVHGEPKLIYDKFEVSLKEESRGVNRLYQVIPMILDALDKGRILVFDEMEASLHECILVELIRLFNDPEKNKGGQLIFSTHNTNLLDADLFRRDQVWFTELNEERATELYSLVEIKNVRKSENLAKGYISGRYGAIPMLNKSILEERH